MQVTLDAGSLGGMGNKAAQKYLPFDNEKQTSGTNVERSMQFNKKIKEDYVRYKQVLYGAVAFLLLTVVVVLWNPFMWPPGYVMVYAIGNLALLVVPALGLYAYERQSLKYQEWFCTLTWYLGGFMLVSILVDTTYWNLPTFAAAVYLGWKGRFLRNLLKEHESFAGTHYDEQAAHQQAAYDKENPAHGYYA
mmetsp:Transcript_83038/g.97033  ORF Transcript_83038/g.97033 Transcript_83038/m.97033 type:complete len:192 (+) Transcript_83038:24-599(+)